MSTPVSYTVYLLHFNRKFGHCQHYIGYSKFLNRRLWHHAHGTGSKFMRQVKLAGITFILADQWDFDTESEARSYEKQLKLRKHACRFCPTCKGVLPCIAADDRESLSLTTQPKSYIETTTLAQDLSATSYHTASAY